MLKILHTADTHLRDRQYARSFRGDDFRKAFHKLVDVAIENNADCIINGGDTFHIARPSATMLATLYEVHGRLKKAGIPMFVVTGNHDAATPSYLEFPALDDYFSLLERVPSQEDLEAFRTQRYVAGMTGVVCIDNLTLNFKGAVISGFPAATDIDTMVSKIKADRPDIVCWHGAISEFVPFQMANAWSMDEMPEGPRAWLLGDIHLRNRKVNKHGALVSYPGTIELSDRGEPAAKFVDLYTLDDDWKSIPFPEPVEIAMDNRPVVYLSVANDAEADQAVEKVMGVIKDNPGRGPLVFMSYAREMKSVVSRMNDVLDPKDSVLLSASFKSNLVGIPGKGDRMSARPELATVVDEVVPRGTPINEIAKRVAVRGVNVRQMISEWVDAKLAN